MGQAVRILASLVSALVWLVLSARPTATAEIVVENGCTLADAIVAANLDLATGGCIAGSGSDEIVLTADVVLTEAVEGENGLPQVLSDIVIRGNGFEIRRDSAAPDFRIISTEDLDFTGSVGLENVTVSGGSLPNGSGGGIFFGARSGELVLTNVTVSGNVAYNGGGIYIDDGYVDVLESLVVGNQAARGGGIHKSYSGYLDVFDSTISSNTATTQGGGLFTDGGFYFFGYPGVAVVSGSTITDNDADKGGGIMSVGGLTLVNSTISSNRGGSSAGGLATYSSFYNFNSVAYSTITNNTTATGSVAGLYDYSFDEGALEIGGVIVSGNVGANCFFDGLGPELSGTNLDDDGSCGNSWEPMTGLDPDLKLNGGPTRTHALFEGSSAVNAVGPCSVGVDQRNFVRGDGACDSGAFELDGGPLGLEGACPGTMTVVAKAAAPDSLLDLYQGPSRGSSQVPIGACAGTDLEITDPQQVGFLTTDANGDGSTTLELTAPDCDDFLQGVTEVDCATTNVVEIEACNVLNLLDSSFFGGSEPVALPDSSAGCPLGTYLPGERITVRARPDETFDVNSWQGTDDDTSTRETNFVTMPAGEHTVVVEYVIACRTLTLTDVGEGDRVVPDPFFSFECPVFTYRAGEPISVTADPAEGWAVKKWSGTADDASRELTNRLKMPDVSHTVGATYFELCGLLQLDHSGEGADPMHFPASSSECEDGRFLRGESVTVRATPEPNWQVGSWSGTDDDSLTTTTNTLTMGADRHTVVVNYVPQCSSLSLERTGSGAIPTALPVPDGVVWNRTPLVDVFEATWAILAADIDGDRDLDIAAASFEEDEISWWQNDLGDGQSWTRHLVESEGDGIQSLQAEDLDGDGDLDLVAAAFREDGVAWWENQAGDGSAWTEHVIVSGIDGPRSVFAADLDGDGDSDILMAATPADTVRWFENDLSDGSSWTEHVISDAFKSASAVASDLDGDGDLDIVATIDDGIGWWENVLGDATTWNEHRLTGVRSFSRVATADFDGDSDQDVLSSTGSSNGRIDWWENRAGDGSLWRSHAVAHSFGGGIGSLVAVDIDSDDDVDVVSNTGDTDRVLWWENSSGDGSRWLEWQIGSEQIAQGLGVATGDVTGDGAPDVMGAASLNSVAVWENVYGQRCGPDQFGFNETLTVTAAPDPGWEVAGWTGTLDDLSTEQVNRVRMPAANHVISVHYVESGQN